ncbi:hypothetical protein PFISCL1PPCAC_4862, partial [Pristionchus fissidentatus]
FIILPSFISTAPLLDQIAMTHEISKLSENAFFFICLLIGFIACLTILGLLFICITMRLHPVDDQRILLHSTDEDE